MRRCATLTLLLLAACPRIDTPLATVSGRIAGASAGAYAYPFGRPDLKTSASTADGAWRIDGVPTSVPSIVLFDGTTHAELVPVALEGGVENRLADRDAASMPLAGTLVAAAIPVGGALATGATYGVIGTDVSAVVQASGSESVDLGPLPGGRFELQVHLAGFAERRVPVDVAAGATQPVGLPLDIDLDHAPFGCGAALACASGLHCNVTNGRCYACTADADCVSGQTCDLALGLCRAGATGTGAVCTSCTGDADCATGLVCTPSGYCSRDCSLGQPCSAGFTCTSGQCVAPTSCTDWLQTMGAPCVADADCSVDLAGGVCDHLPNAPGRCTASCSVTADCQVGTFAASAITCSGTPGRCAPP